VLTDNQSIPKSRAAVIAIGSRWIALAYAAYICVFGQGPLPGKQLTISLLLFLFLYNLVYGHVFAKSERLLKSISPNALATFDLVVCLAAMWTGSGLQNQFLPYFLSCFFCAALIARSGDIAWSSSTLTSACLIFPQLGRLIRTISLPGIQNTDLFFFSGLGGAVIILMAFVSFWGKRGNQSQTGKLSGDEMRSVCRTAERIRSALTLEEVLHVAVEDIYQLTEAGTVVFAQLDENQPDKIKQDGIVVRDQLGIKRACPRNGQLAELAIHLAHNDLTNICTNSHLATDSGPHFGEEPFICIPICRVDKRLGLIVVSSPIRFTSTNHLMLLSILSNLIAASVYNAGLAQRTEISAITKERNRIARDMHDCLIQSLYSQLLNLEICTKLLESNPSKARKKLAELQELVSANITETRRFIHDLCPGDLQNQTLPEALATYTQKFTSVNGLRADFKTIGTQKTLPANIENTLYWVTKEALSNARRHSKAQHVNVQLAFRDSKVVLLIEDDGAGFDSSNPNNNSIGRDEKGLTNIKTRTLDLGGKYTIASKAGLGTRLEIRIPLS
jgi:signal transduction histidine kinase